MKRAGLFLLLIAGIIVLDQMTKGAIQTQMVLGESYPVIDGFFNITYVLNPGAAFGMGANAPDWARAVFFLALPVLACIWLCVLIFQSLRGPLLAGLSYTFILAGAIGNLVDRFSQSQVVDFLDFYWGQSHFPAFNVADSAITIGAGLLILDFIVQSKKTQESSKKEE